MADSGTAKLPSRVFATPDFTLLGNVSFASSRSSGWSVRCSRCSRSCSPISSTPKTACRAWTGCCSSTRWPPRSAAAVGGAASASSATTYIESASGISEGGRTGLASIVTGLLFLTALFASPLAGVIPPEATAPALILVGFLMMSVVRELPWNDYAVAIPAFLTMVVMPFSYSITDGIGWGFVSYTVVKLATGQIREVHWMTVLSSVLFVAYFARLMCSAASSAPAERIASITLPSSDRSGDDC